MNTADSIQDFLCKLSMKPNMYLVETVIISLYHVIVRATKSIKDLLKDYKILIFNVIFQRQKSKDFLFFLKNIGLTNFY